MTNCEGFPGAVRAQGFRHFIRKVECCESTRFDLAVPADQALLEKLAEVQGRTRVRQEARSDLPAGFTYLLQLVAHDMVDSSRPFWATGPDAVVDRRICRLMLDTIYGRGAEPDPALAETLAPNVVRMKLGEMPAAHNATPGGQARDFPRIPVAGSPGALCPAAADRRNDYHSIIAQLSVLFLQFHNAVADLVPDATFKQVRQVVTLVYRWIIRHELLDRLIQPHVFRHYDAAGAVHLDKAFMCDPHGPLPLEFSHGAFRFGHMMVREIYQFTADGAFGPPDHTLVQMLMQSSFPVRGAPGHRLKADWAIAWSRFFDGLPGLAPNRSARIGPTFAPALRRDGLFDPEPARGLPIRDLMSAVASDVWRVNALVTHLHTLPDAAAMLAKAPRLAGAAWEAPLRAWLVRELRGATAPEIERLVGDPPLPFFVGFEARLEGDGSRLGTLGSIIVADTLFAVLRTGPLAVAGEAALAPLLERVVGGPAVAAIGAELGHLPDTMARIVAFVAKRAPPGAVKPAFV